MEGHRLTDKVAELRLHADGRLEFRPSDDDFPLHRGDFETLALGDGWYRLPRALSPAAARRFSACAPTLLPREVVLTVGRGAADADHSGGYVIGAGDSMPCPARAGRTTSSRLRDDAPGERDRSAQ